jgi:hypothetical protein
LTNGYPRGVHERGLEQAADDIGRCRRRASHAAWLSGAAALVGGIAAPFSLLLAAALLAGALVETLVAGHAVYRRAGVVSSLALHPAAYALPEVAAYGRKAAQPRQRARLAAWLSEVVAEAQAPHSLYLADRVALVAHELEALARELTSPRRSVEPVSAVACRRLLTNMIDSPLYNPRLPVDDLQVALRRIRAGIA